MLANCWNIDSEPEFKEFYIYQRNTIKDHTIISDSYNYCEANISLDIQIFEESGLVAAVFFFERLFHFAAYLSRFIAKAWCRLIEFYVQ